jgi:mannose-6-phosphate isomerase-like protein (cupin superfamily)
MNQLHVKPEKGFKVVAGTGRSQAATMVLVPQESTGGPTNKHLNSDQWLYVISGVGKATISGKKINLVPGMLLLIEAGEPHEIVNTGDKPLETLNIYAPPEY